MLNITYMEMLTTRLGYLCMTANCINHQFLEVQNKTLNTEWYLSISIQAEIQERKKYTIYFINLQYLDFSARLQMCVMKVD